MLERIGSSPTGKEIIKERRGHFMALRMILHSEREWIIAQPHLLDDVVRSAPSFHLKIVAQPVDSLMVRAIHFLEPMRGGALRPQGLDIMVARFRIVMAGNIQVQRSPQRDIEELHPFADCENRKA